MRLNSCRFKSCHPHQDDTALISEDQMPYFSMRSLCGSPDLILYLFIVLRYNHNEMKKYRKHSRRNPWRNTRRNMDRDWKAICAAVLVVSVPLMVILGTLNYVVRYSGVWKYDLTSSQVLTQISTQIDEDQLLNAVSSYMQHKTDSFELKEDVEYQPENVFKAVDKKAAKRIREFMDVTMVIGIIMLLLTAAAYFLLIRWRSHEIHMKRFRQSVWVYAISIIVLCLICVIPPARHLVWGLLMGTKLPADDTLVVLFGGTLGFHIAMYWLLISAVITGILTYVTWEIAGRKRMFRGLE